MKGSALFLLAALVIFSCKNENSTTVEDNSVVENDSIRTAKQSDGLIMFTGKFIYFADAAVLQTDDNTMYGVVINEKMHELADMVKKYKKEDTDFVPVAVIGIRIAKADGEEGWPYKIDIKEIVDVYKPNPEDDEVIKL